MFRKNRYYAVEEVAGEKYLLPFGQALAELRRGFRINDTGVFLWNKLDENCDRKILVDYLIKQFGIDPMLAKNDVDTFIDQLLMYKVINEEKKEELYPSNVLTIGGLNIGLYGNPIFFYREELKLFESNAENIDLRFIVKVEYPEFLEGRVLVRNGDMIVEENEECFILRYPKQKYIHEVRIYKNKDEAIAYVWEVGNDVDRKLIGDTLYNALRTFFFYCARKKGMYAIHSASILYKNKAWLFSGISGAGKSTHTELWRNLYDVELLNGDINLVSIKGHKAYVHGIPWCGTSYIYTNKTVELGGVILLSKAEHDYVEELDQSLKQLLVSQRMISPVWNRGMLKQNLDFCGVLKNLVLVCRLHCTKNYTAVGVIKQRIDESKYEYQD